MIEVVRGAYSLRPTHHGSVVSIGNFDGVHRGHVAIIEKLKRKAEELSLPCVVVTFEPHPLEYFAGTEAPPRIMSFRQKVEALQGLGVDRVLCLRFDSELANTTAEEFVKTLLVDGLGARHVLVGDDFRFGKDRSGDFSFLSDCGARLGFDVENTPTVRVDDDRVSSSAIRICLAKGDLATAARLLGRPWAVTGHVAHGDKRGREWGFPTLNLYPRWSRPPVTGIFAVRVQLDNGTDLPGAGYIGRRPVIANMRLVIEVHLLDYEADLYGERIRVDFLHKIRDDIAFENMDELAQQMRNDVASIRQYLLASPGKNPN